MKSRAELYEIYQNHFSGNLNINLRVTFDKFYECYKVYNEDVSFNWFLNNGLDIETLFIFVYICIGSYNDFHYASVKKLPNIFGLNAKYYIAREQSVCIYVKPSQNLHLSNVLERLKELEVDEFYYDASLGLFRLWWD